MENSISMYFDKSNIQDPTIGFDWEYILIDNKKVKNAWCMPGGKIAVYTGILEVTKNTNGLAAVMGHEIAHAVGLSHRVGKDYANNIDPLDVRFDDRDTIMSYRDSACNPPEEDYFLTELDIKALRTLWGVEKNN